MNFEKMINDKVMLNFIFGKGIKRNDVSEKILGLVGIYEKNSASLTNIEFVELYTGGEDINVSVVDDEETIQNYTKLFNINKDENGGRNIVKVTDLIYEGLDTTYTGTSNILYNQGFITTSSSATLDTDRSKYIDRFNIELNSRSKLMLIDDYVKVQILFPFSNTAPMINLTRLPKDNLVVTFNIDEFFTKDKQCLYNSYTDATFNITKQQLTKPNHINDIKNALIEDSSKDLLEIFKYDEFEEDTDGKRSIYRNLRNGIYRIITRDENKIEDLIGIGNIDDNFILAYTYRSDKEFILHHNIHNRFDEEGNVVESIFLGDKEYKRVDSVSDKVKEVFFKYSTIFSEEDMNDENIFGYENTIDNVPPHTIIPGVWDDGTIEFVSHELMEDGTDNESGETIQNKLEYGVSIYCNENKEPKYMMETYSYNEGTDVNITTIIYSVEEDDKIYEIDQIIKRSIFETKTISEYNMDDLKFRIIDQFTTDISGNTKTHEYIYEADELYVKYDLINNKFLDFNSKIYNLADDYIFVRDIWGNLEKRIINQ